MDLISHWVRFKLRAPFPVSSQPAAVDVDIRSTLRKLTLGRGGLRCFFIFVKMMMEEDRRKVENAGEIEDDQKIEL